MGREIMKTIIDTIQENGRMIKEMVQGKKSLKINRESTLEILLMTNTMGEEN